MRYFVYVCTFLLLLWAAFAQAGFDLAPKTYWFKTESNLLKKEPIMEQNTLRLVTPQGLLLYAGFLPFSDKAKYLRSHDIADQPCWQGYLIAAYAFKEAVTGQDQDDKIEFLADGLLKYFVVSGIQGFLARSIIPDYTGPRLDWMDTPQNNPTKYWMQGPKGQWFRNGVAKGHVTTSIFGASIALTLERNGYIHLKDSTRSKLVAFMVPLVSRIAHNNFQILDWNGRTTEFGDLSPQLLNGFNMLLILHMLKSASWYDASLAKIYKKSMKNWYWRINWSLTILGNVTRGLIGEDHGQKNRPSVSDMQHLALAYLSLHFQETNRTYMKEIRKGMRGIWDFMRYLRNPMFTIPYFATIRNDEGNRMNEVIEDLRDFPLDKYEVDQGRTITKQVQPLANRPFDTNYWKQSPFLKATKPIPPRTGEEETFASMDYLLAYWMGRFFHVMPAE